MARLEHATSLFRTELAAGRSVGDAASLALECDPAFDTGGALRLLVREGLITGLLERPQECTR